MQKHNFHTHTRYSDGHDTVREMTERAIELGFTSLGFTDHSYSANESDYSMSASGTKDEYYDVLRTAQNYRDKIRIYAGIEMDPEGGMPEFDYDFILSSIHHMVRHGVGLPIDSGAEMQLKLVNDLFGGSYIDFAKAYFNNLTEHVLRQKTDIVGHIDLPAKYGLAPEDDPRYIGAAAEAVREISKHCRIFELNTGAIARGLKTVPYPAPAILDEIKACGCSVIINSDCHYRSKLTCWFDEAEEYLASHGFVRFDNERLNDKIDGITLWK